MIEVCLESVRTYLNRNLNRLKRLRPKHVLPDVVLIIGCTFISLYLRLGWSDYGPSCLLVLKFLPLLIAIRLITFTLTGVYDIIWRYTSFNDAVLLIKAVFISSFIQMMLITRYFYVGLYSRFYLIQFFVLSMSLIAVRLIRRQAYEYPLRARLKKNGRPTLIYGAGRNGSGMAYRLEMDTRLGYQPLGFIDDDPEKSGRSVGGLRVLGGIEDLDKVLETTGTREIVVAISHPSSELLLKISGISRRHGIKPRIMNLDATSEKHQAEIVRDIDLNDLLRRKRKEIDLSDLKKIIPGKTILITGAGGSIGSELTKQLFSFHPKTLLILDHSEFNLYEIHRELQENGGGTFVVPLLLDIKNKDSLERVFDKYSPHMVFHAAAYKHVHLAESNPGATILNNILGTRNLLELAEEHDVESFTMISTDKAVNPVRVMGATKRVCELLVTDIARRTGRRFVSVRFGNVLGSSGSLIPLLKEQIFEGKGVTITHKEMKRYFMLIPEAVSLVLRAGSIASSGDIMVLEMGEPIRIVDLARSLIALMGRREDEIPLIFTGIRPGEKLQEELYLTGSEIKTEDQNILVIPGGDNATGCGVHDVLGKKIDSIIRNAHQGATSAITQMYALIRHNESTDQSEIEVDSELNMHILSKFENPATQSSLM